LIQRRGRRVRREKNIGNNSKSFRTNPSAFLCVLCLEKSGLIKRAGVEPHPAVFFRELDDAAIVFGGTSKPDDDFELLHVIDFSSSKYWWLHHYGIDRQTYFYWELLQALPFGNWTAIGAVDDADFKELLRKSFLY
ncbi:MAG: hypothetical protein ABSE73_22420, partial [Planctomycetota bacterium]